MNYINKYETRGCDDIRNKITRSIIKADIGIGIATKKRNYVYFI